MTIKAVIWDVGGVLLRTENPLPRQKLAERLGMERKELERHVFWGESGSEAQLGKKSYENHSRDVLMLLGLSWSELTQFEQEFWGGDEIDNGLIETIRQLHQDGLKTGILSNAFSNLRALLVSDWQISDAFDTVVISAEVGLVKPDPRIYQLILKSLGVSPEQAVFIDDSSENIEAARSLSMSGILFTSPKAVTSELEQLIANSR